MEIVTFRLFLGSNRDTRNVRVRERTADRREGHLQGHFGPQFQISKVSKRSVLRTVVLKIPSSKLRQLTVALGHHLNFRFLQVTLYVMEKNENKITILSYFKILIIFSFISLQHRTKSILKKKITGAKLSFIRAYQLVKN